MAISAEQLNVILSARDKEFQRKMRDAERRVQRFQKKSTDSLSQASKGFDLVSAAARRILPALAAGVVIGQLQRITAEMDEIGKKADQIGVTTDALQELRFVAEGAGVTQEKFTSSLERFSKRLGEAEMGTGAAKNALEQLNLQASDLTAMSLDDALGVIADKMQQIESPTERAALAAALFGREGVAMVNMLREGSDALDGMRQSARDAGAVIDEDLIRNAEEAQTRLDAAARVIKAQLSVALAELVPIIVAGAEGFASFVKNVVGAIKAVDQFLDPQSDLEVAIDNVVLAMGDEIEQSKQLAIALGTSTNMSVEAAKEKLKEAKARHENAKAALAERQAIMSSLEAKIADMRSMGEGSGRSARGARLGADRLSNRLEEMRADSAGIEEQFSRTEANVNRLDTAISNASDGIVDFGNSSAETITRSDRLSNSVSRTATSTAGLVDNLADAEAALKALGLSGDQIDKIFEQFGKTIDEAGPALEALGLNVEQTENLFKQVESSMESAFMSMIDGTMSAKDAFRSMASDIIRELFRVLVVQRLVGSFSSGGGGILGSVFTGLTGRASGGSVQAGQPYMTGESGRELFVPQTNGRILSPAQTNNAMGGGGDNVTVNQTINVSTGVQQTVRTEIKSLMPQIAESAKGAVVDAKRRGGSYGRSFA